MSFRNNAKWFFSLLNLLLVAAKWQKTRESTPTSSWAYSNSWNPTVSLTTQRMLKSRLCMSMQIWAAPFTKAANRRVEQRPGHFHLTLPPLRGLVWTTQQKGWNAAPSWGKQLQLTIKSNNRWGEKEASGNERETVRRGTSRREEREKMMLWKQK